MPIDPTRPSSDYTTYVRERADIVKRGTLDFSSSLFKSAVFASAYAPREPPVTPTILTYSGNHGDSIVWSGITFTRNTSLPNYSYMSTTASIPITQVPNPTDLIGVLFGESITSIDGDYNEGTGPFTNCTSLASVIIGNSVKTIGNNVFGFCGFTSIIIPNSVTSIGDGAFYDCTSLTSVIIGNSVTSIGEFAFEFCTRLESVIIGNSVETIDGYAFGGCAKLASIIIPNSVISIGSNAFEYSGLTTVIISDLQLPNIRSPASGVSFYGKEGVTTVPPELTVLTYSGGYGDIVVWSGITFTRNTSLPNYSYTSTTVLSIPGTVVPNHSDLKRVVIGNSVTTIGEGAFEFCTSLTSVTIPNSVKTIGDYAFSGCTSLASVILGNSVITIGDDAFGFCTSLTSVTIPNSVTSIGIDAFYGCTSLASVIIGNSVKTIGEDAFDGCTELASVILGNSVITIGGYAFYDCTSLTSITIPNSVTSIGDNAFQYSGLTTVTIANGQLGISSPDSDVDFFGVFVTTVLP